MNTSNKNNSTEMESTATLLAKVRHGETGAIDKLCSIYLPLLTKWAHGRLPRYVRDLSETDDMVQSSLFNALKNIKKFEPLHEGAFLAYLRKILLNNIRMEIRRHSKVGLNIAIDNTDELPSSEASSLEVAAGKEILDSYEEALTMLAPRTREAVILKVEFGFSHAEIAAAIHAPSANAARMLVSRALLTLAKEMK